MQPTLLPDGSPDVQIRSAVGGQKLRDIMLDGHVDLYGPYVRQLHSSPVTNFCGFVFFFLISGDLQARPLLNCCGGGTCGTCLVEVC